MADDQYFVAWDLRHALHAKFLLENHTVSR